MMIWKKLNILYVYIFFYLIYIIFFNTHVAFLGLYSKSLMLNDTDVLNLNFNDIYNYITFF